MKVEEQVLSGTKDVAVLFPPSDSMLSPNSMQNSGFQTPKESAASLFQIVGSLLSDGELSKDGKSRSSVPRRLSTSSLKLLAASSGPRGSVGADLTLSQLSADKTLGSKALMLLGIDEPYPKTFPAIAVSGIRRSQSLTASTVRAFKSPRASVGMVDQLILPVGNKSLSFENVQTNSSAESTSQNTSRAVEHPVASGSSRESVEVVPTSVKSPIFASAATSDDKATRGGATADNLATKRCPSSGSQDIAFPVTNDSSTSTATVIYSPPSDKSSLGSLSQTWPARESGVAVEANSTNTTNSSQVARTDDSAALINRSARARRHNLPTINFAAFRGQDAFPQTEKNKLRGLVNSSMQEDVIADPNAFLFLQNFDPCGSAGKGRKLNRFSRFFAAKGASKKVSSQLKSSHGDSGSDTRVNGEGSPVLPSAYAPSGSALSFFVNYSMPQKEYLLGAEQQSPRGSRQRVTNGERSSLSSKIAKKLNVEFRMANKKKKTVRQIAFNLLKLYIQDKQSELAFKLVQSFPPNYLSQHSIKKSERIFMRAMLAGLESLCVFLTDQGVLRNINESVLADYEFSDTGVEADCVTTDKQSSTGGSTTGKLALKLPSWLLLAQSLGLEKLAKCMVQSQMPDPSYAWYGITYLSLAAAKGQTELVQILLSKGCNPLHPSLTLARLQRLRKIKAPFVQHLQRPYASPRLQHLTGSAVAQQVIKQDALAVAVYSTECCYVTGHHVSSTSHSASLGDTDAKSGDKLNLKLHTLEKDMLTQAEKLAGASTANASLPLLLQSASNNSSSDRPSIGSEVPAVDSCAIGAAQNAADPTVVGVTLSCPSQLEIVIKSSEPVQSGVSKRDISDGFGVHSQARENAVKVKSLNLRNQLVFPLDLALANGQMDTAQSILELGPCAVATVSNFSLLHNKLYVSEPPGILFFQLLAVGCDPNQKNSVGQTPLHLAANMGNLEACIALLQFRAKINEQDMSGWCPLHEAISTRHWNLASYIISKEADKSIKTNNGETAQSMAQSMNVSDAFLDRLFLSDRAPELLAGFNSTFAEREMKVQSLIKQAVTAIALRYTHSPLLVEPASSIHATLGVNGLLEASTSANRRQSALLLASQAHAGKTISSLTSPTELNSLRHGLSAASEGRGYSTQATSAPNGGASSSQVAASNFKAGSRLSTLSLRSMLSSSSTSAATQPPVPPSTLTKASDTISYGSPSGSQSTRQPPAPGSAATEAQGKVKTVAGNSSADRLLTTMPDPQPLQRECSPPNIKASILPLDNAEKELPKLPSSAGGIECARPNDKEDSSLYTEKETPQDILPSNCRAKSDTKTALSKAKALLRTLSVKLKKK